MTDMELLQQYYENRSEQHQQKQHNGSSRKRKVPSATPRHRQNDDAQRWQRAEQQQCKHIEPQTNVTPKKYAHGCGDSGSNE
jgi:hypothetical protein